MKLCAFLADGKPCVGVAVSDGVVNITQLGFPSHMSEVIEGGADLLADISAALSTKNIRTLDEDSLEYLPVSDPKKIICKGLNYKSHAEETGKSAPEYPVFFNKFNDSLSAHAQPVTLPRWLDTFDHEAELVIVIGKAAYNVPAATADEYIFGYTCGNDLSSRTAQALSDQWLCGKALPGFAPVGPFIVTRDSFNPNESHGVYCELNGVIAQSGTTSDMIFSCSEIVSAASKFFPLSPGDLIFTGTPPGVIVGRKEEDRIWLKPGDVVSIKIDGIGTLTTPLI